MKLSLKNSLITLLFAELFSFVSCSQGTETHEMSSSKLPSTKNELIMDTNNIDTATFGAGCFWCVEAVFQRMNGVVGVASGYSGGAIKNPSYKEVCTGRTGHAEVIQVYYNPEAVSFKELLEVFWVAHDPTTLNRQGNDVGTQYRSVIYYHSEEQQQLAELYKKKLNDEKAFDNPVVTEISPFTIFYKAEDYHQNYFNENGSQPYCSFVVAPKVDKFKKVFADKVKPEYK